MTLGSLFDGSGTCPLAATMCGITPLWASEIEPYPIRVTTKNFPGMEHLGSVTDINGAEVKPVDIITFGSPCQDLSIAGKRAGIHDGQRSNLFFEAIRIIKEMREATHGKYPTFAVWENVPGAFSSNVGDDFLAVLRAFAEVWGADVPEPARTKGKIKWAHAGCIMGDGYSLAWRMLDAQYWGVPQRRKRIYLVADFAGGRAPEILFKRKGLSGDSAESGAPGQGTADDDAGSAGGSRDAKCLNPWDYQSKRIYQPGGVYPTLPAMDCSGANNQAVLYALDSMSSNSMKSSNPHSGFHAETVAKTLQAGGVDPTCNQGGNVIVEPIYTLQGNGIDCTDTAAFNGKGWREDVSYTLNTIDRPAICFKAGQGAKARSLGESETVSPTLGIEAGGNSVPSVCYPKVFHSLTATNAGNVESAQQPNCVCYPRVVRTLTAEADASPCIDRGQNVVCYDECGNGDGTHCPTLTGDHENRVTDYTAVCVYGQPKFGEYKSDNFTSTLKARDYKDASDLIIGHHPIYRVDCRNAVLDAEKTHTLQTKPPRKYIIRRLTPLECCRLQGFPDWWEDGAQGSDSARYKMWGNGMALPCVVYVMQGIADAKKDNNSERDMCLLGV